MKKTFFLSLTLCASVGTAFWSGCSSSSGLVREAGVGAAKVGSTGNNSASKTNETVKIAGLSKSLQNINLDDDEALSIGYKIWRNECRGSIEGLTSWNKGEEFASLGIGHFIWFPAGCKVPFGEAFPQLVDFLLAHEQGAQHVPEWLQSAFARGERTCPWQTREVFLEAIDSEEMRSLRLMLASTVSLQARFIGNRLEASLPKILNAAPEKDRERIQAQFYRVAASPTGLYVLADYVNFKGEGIKTSEHYGYRGWGLLQVLQGMNGEGAGTDALREFAASAEARLTERVENAPPERNEQRWLPGWKRRLRTYLAKR